MVWWWGDRRTSQAMSVRNSLSNIRASLTVLRLTQTSVRIISSLMKAFLCFLLYLTVPRRSNWYAYWQISVALFSVGIHLTLTTYTNHVLRFGDSSWPRLLNFLIPLISAIDNICFIGLRKTMTSIKVRNVDTCTASSNEINYLNGEFHKLLWAVHPWQPETQSSVLKDVAVDSTNYQKLPTKAELRFKGRFLCCVLFMYESWDSPRVAPPLVLMK